MVEHLNSQFDFYIVTRNTEYLETIPYAGVQSDAWVDFTPGVKVFYASKQNEGLRLWQSLINQGGFSAVYINGIYSIKYSLLPLIAAKRQKVAKIIVSPRGMLSPSAINVKSHKKKLFLHVVKLLRLYNGVHWHVTNQKEAEEVHGLCGKSATVTIAANLARKSEMVNLTIEKNMGEVKLCSFARISPEKNTLFALQVLLAIKTTSRISFDLYGQIYDQVYWHECLDTIAQMPANIYVSYKSVVDAEIVGETISTYHALFLPSRGENFGHVILESLMAGRPVIISDQTPWRQMQEKVAGWDLPLSDIPAFAKVISELADMDQVEYHRYTQGALEVAQAFVNDASVLRQYQQLFQ